MHRWVLLVAMSFILGLALLDETVVSLALPTITEEFGMSLTGAHWVVNSYLLIFSALVALGGKLADLVNINYLVFAGIIVFSLASLACGFAPTGNFLIGARAAQGIGAAIIFPLPIATISRIFPAKHRGFAFGVYASIACIFMASGPLVSGYFTSELSWRWIFWVNLPMSLLVFLVFAIAPLKGRHAYGGDRSVSDYPFDWLGITTLLAGLFFFVMAIMEAPDWGWEDNMTIWAGIVGIAALTLFVWNELSRKNPLIQLHFFKDPSFAVAAFIVFQTQFSKIVLFIFGALYFQEALGFPPLVAGIALMAALMLNPVTASMSGVLVDKYGPRAPAMWGLPLVTGSMIWITAFISLDNYWLLLPALTVWGAGMPFVFLPSTKSALESVDLEKRGQASGVMISFQMLGGTIGMSISSSVFIATNSYQLVFGIATALMLLCYLLAYFYFLKKDSTKTQK
ncbi:Multidrug resistance protein stp [Pseudovibrio axinellae]|uniref:Multidrug resistance protein stp n=2 Tax=Pseudovibrio axinellae TaxID=989403 RepID=A0A165YVP7_9HYPH|nr:Multidrug resistance protein stp [Pseudovibrio axinellae]SEQ43172.1 drug resistance transporter, EmrB/QacA subfamily [Pseudovibrio axinellae]